MLDSAALVEDYICESSISTHNLRYYAWGAAKKKHTPQKYSHAIEHLM